MHLLTGFGLATALLWATGAQAMMPPYVYEEARENAAYHLSVAIVSVAASANAVGECRIEGEIVAIERDRTGTLAVGDQVSFSVDCLRADADPEEIPSCVSFLPTERLVAGARLNGYMNGGPDEFRVAEGLISFTDGPSVDEPDDTNA